MITIHAFTGGRNNPQVRAICGAKDILRELFGDRLVFKEVDNDTAKLWGWSEQDLVNWLTMNDAIYIVGCHPHQGIGNTWSPEVLYHEMRDLQQFCGFPSSIHLGCPIFRQDKIGYLHVVPEICNPTLRIFFEANRDYSDYVNEVSE